MNLYGKYLKEREGFSILDAGYGFVTYKFCGENNEQCLIGDMFILGEYRRNGKGSRLADTLTQIAKSEGCKFLSSSIDPRTNGATVSAQAILGYGFELVGINDGLIWFRKEL